MNIYMKNIKRISELENTFPDVDWIEILSDGGITAVEEYAEFVEHKNKDIAPQGAGCKPRRQQ